MGYQRNIKTERIIQSADELAGTLKSDVLYRIDGLIDMGSTEITVPAGGLFLSGSDYFKSGLYSDDNNFILFKTASGIPTSNVRIQELNFWASGTDSKLLDLDGTGNFGAIEFNSCNLGDFAGQTTEIGELTGFRQFRTNDSGFFRAADGLTFSGAWSGGFRIGDSIALSTVGTMTLFKEGTSLTFGGRCVSDINASSLSDTTTVFDFQESNFTEDGTFQLNGAAFNPDATALSNIDETSTKVFFRDCVGIKNTRPGASMEFTTQATTALTQDTPVKASGTTTTNDDTWFGQTASNELTCQTSLAKDYRFDATIRIDGGPNDIINCQIRKWDESTSSYVVVKEKAKNINNVIGGLDVADFTIIGTVELELNDRIEIWIENQSDNTDAVVLTGSEIILQAI